MELVRGSTGIQIRKCIDIFCPCLVMLSTKSDSEPAAGEQKSTPATLVSPRASQALDSCIIFYFIFSFIHSLFHLVLQCWGLNLEPSH